MLKIKIPEGFNFDGVKFGTRFFADFQPNIPDPRFWVDAEGYLVCPSLELDTIDLNEFEAQPIIETEVVFDKPVRTPALYAQDVFVSSRDIKDDPDEAFHEAMQETRKEKGQPKSLDLIARSALKALERSREDIKDLKKTISDLEKRLKKLEK